MDKPQLTVASTSAPSLGVDVFLVTPDGDNDVALNYPEPDWSLVRVGDYPTISPHGGGGMAKYNSLDARAENMARLSSGSLDLSLTSNPQLTFWMSHNWDTSEFNDDYIQVQVSTNGSIWTDVGDPVKRRSMCASCWVQHPLALGDYNQTGVYIGFLGVSKYGHNIYLDDIVAADGYTSILSTGFEDAVPPTGWSETLVWYGNPLQGALQSYGDLGAVDLFDEREATPTLSQLQAYDVVVTWSGIYPSEIFVNAAALGDVLADYVDWGG